MEMMPLQPCMCLCHEEQRESSSQGRPSVLSGLGLLLGAEEVFLFGSLPGLLVMGAEQVPK